MRMTCETKRMDIIVPFEKLETTERRFLEDGVSPTPPSKLLHN